LFSTVSDLSIFAQMMLNGGSYNGVRIIADSTVAKFTKRAAGTRALGWDTCAGSYGCGQYMGAESYGHTGFTGTSLWIDPEREMFVILLTNRVHAAKARRPAKVISDVRADLADAAELAVTDVAGGPIAMPRSFRSDKAIGWNKPERTAKKSKSKKSSSAKGSKSSKSSKGSASSRKSSAKKAPAKKSGSKKK
jgi:CubicO group peptidase (beta-lactamase class C family)